MIFPLDGVSFAVQSLLDDNGLAEVSRAAEDVKKAVEQQEFRKATELWSVAETVVEQVGTTQEDPQQKSPLLFFIYRELSSSENTRDYILIYCIYATISGCIL